MRLCLFSKKLFEVKDPEALIEAYCFQSNFYVNYDLLLRQRKRTIEDVNLIGARIKEAVLSECKAKVPFVQSKGRVTENLQVFRSSNLDAFLKLDEKKRDSCIRELSEVAKELKRIDGIGFSKATKILHTLYPETIPIIDNALQKEYKEINLGWTKGDWRQVFTDYYDNFLFGDTYRKLCQIHNRLSFLRLTKIRIFDILWWSYLKAERITREKGINWSTISCAPT